MRYTLRPYQERSVQEAIDHGSRYEAFDMGLGKTLIMLDYLKRTGQKALVLAPMQVALRTWPQEIEKWTPELSYSVMHGYLKDDLYSHDADLKIINYDGLPWLQKRMYTAAKVIRGRVLILDEATAIKNPTSQRFKILKSMYEAKMFSRVFCLSGTPLPNGYVDLWSPYYLIDGGKALGPNITAYKRAHFIESGPPRWTTRIIPGSEEKIQQAIAPVTSVLRAEDHLDMPESFYHDVIVKLPEPALKLYKQVKTHKIGKWMDFEFETENAASVTNRLRQIVQGCLYTENGAHIPVHTAKLDALENIVTEANGKPILCPINFKFEVEQIRARMGYNVPCIYGKTPAADRNKWLDDWDKGKIPLLLCHPLSLSHGLNMQTGGNTIVWYGIPWSWEHYKQLNGRLIRSGQRNTVMVYFLRAAGTVDDRVASVLKNKEATEDDFKLAMLED